MDSETKAKLFEALKDPEMALTLQAVLTPIVDKAVAQSVGEAVSRAVQTAMEAMEARMEAKDQEILRLKRDLTDSETKLDELEQYSRKNSLNITGIPESQGESTSQLIRDLGKMIGVDINRTDIDACHRIGRQTASKPRTIIVKFTRYDQRQDVYAARKKLREVSAPVGAPFTRQQLENIYISDNLTSRRQAVLYVARQLKRKGKLFAAWSDAGRLKVRISRGGNTKVISTNNDLRELVGDDPELIAVTHSADPGAAPGRAPGGAVAPGKPPPAPVDRWTRSKDKRAGRH